MPALDPLALPDPERNRRAAQGEAQASPRVLSRGRLGVVMLQQVAAQMRDLEIAIVVGAASRPRQDVIDGCRQRVIRPRGTVVVLPWPVDAFALWDVFHDQLTCEDRYFRRRSADRPGGVAADTAYPMVPIADPDQPGDGHNPSISAA